MDGNKYLGIELGSTRVKAILCDETYQVIARGSSTWENDYIDGYWTYSLEDAWKHLQNAYKELAKEYSEATGEMLNEVSAIGISGMMHGYLAFDRDENLLVPFRTWRNNRQGKASKELTELFGYAIPERFSITHHYQSILNQEGEVNKVDYLTTLAGYIHWKLTGEKVIGIGEASGMFPIQGGDYNSKMMDQYNNRCMELGYKVDIQNILPRVLVAGVSGGRLSKEGALLIDPSGRLKANILLCPPEGDAGTGMVATNSVKPGTGNVSCGTSIFAMIVLNKELNKLHKEIDLVTTPMGDPVAMVHVNNGTSDINAWVNLFGQAASVMGASFTKEQLYEKLFKLSLEGKKDCSNMLSYGYVSGEHLVELEEGKPLFIRSCKSEFTLANVMRTHLYSSLAILRMGLDILTEEEGIVLNSITGHGGFFKTQEVGQRFMAAATRTPIRVLSNSGEGGPWGMALLAAYMFDDRGRENFSNFLNDCVFKNTESKIIKPDREEIVGFDQFLRNYINGLTIEREAVRTAR